MALSKEKAGAAGGASSSSSSPLGAYLPLVRPPLFSATRTFANLVLCIVGVWVLGLPYTVSTVGWVMGILTLLLASALTYHGMMLQLYSKRRLCKSVRGDFDLVIASYGDLAFHAFGSWGRFSVDVLLTLATFSASIANITFVSQNFASIASSVQGTDIQGMPVQRSHSSSQMAFSTTVAPCVGLSSLTCAHNMSSVRIDPAKNHHVQNTSRVAHRNYTFPGYIHDNQSSFELGFGNNSLAEPSHQNGSSLGAKMRFSVGSLTRRFLVEINWSSSTTYTWCMFPLVVALCAIPSITLSAPLSLLGNTLNFAALTVVMVSDVLEIKTTPGLRNMKAFGDMVAVPSAFGVGVYAFDVSGLVIPLEASMEQPLKFGSVMGLAFVLIAVLFAIFSVLGYAAFGANTQQIITLNLRAGIEAVLIKTAISFSVFSAFPLVLTPLFELAERRFSRRKLSLVLRTIVVFVICLLSTVVTQFADFLSLSGSTISCILAFILPGALHIKVINENGEAPATILPNIADYLVITCGLILGAFGTIVSFFNFF